MSNNFIKVHDCTQLSTQICESRQYYDNNGRCSINDDKCLSLGNGEHSMMVYMIAQINDLQKSVDRVENKISTCLAKNFSA